MSDKEVQIIDGVIKGILAFLSNHRHGNINNRNEWSFFIDLFLDMNVPQWINEDDQRFVQRHWKSCVSHALMILESEYQYD